MSSIIFLASFQSSLMFVDYQINRNFYEIHCVNKDKLEMNCHGKCQVIKNAEDPNVPLQIVKIGFEFNFFPQDLITLKDIVVSEDLHIRHLFSHTVNSVAKGYSTEILHPPRI